MSTDDTTFRVWIGCLSCYNAGFLIGDWYPALEAGEVATKDLHAAHNIVTDEAGYVLGAEIYGPHEELWVMDLDNAPAGNHHEMNPYEAQQLAEAMGEIEDSLDDEEQVEIYFAWLKDTQGNVPSSCLADYVSVFEDRFRGVWDSFREYADDYADEQMACMGIPRTPCSGESWNQAMREVGAGIEFLIQHFDYEGHARDLEMYHSTYRLSDGRVAVFSDN